MTEYRSPRHQRDEQANRVVVAALAGLLVVVLVVIALVSLTPARQVQTPVSAGAVSSAASAASANASSSLKAASTLKPAHAAKPSVSKSTAPKAPVVTPAQVPAPVVTAKTTPEEMAKLPQSARQIIVITGDKIGSNSGTLALYNKEGDRWTEAMNVAANFGKNGLIAGTERREGNFETPTGIWTLGSFLFGLHASAPAGTKMPYRPITRDSYWSSVRDSTYNTWVNHKVDGEHLITSDPQYEYAFNTGYNSPPNQRVMGRGTAIFIHCFEPQDNSLGKYTHGCVAIAPANAVRLFRALDPAKHPVCAIGTLRNGTSTSIWAY